MKTDNDVLLSRDDGRARVAALRIKAVRKLVGLAARLEARSRHGAGAVERRDGEAFGPPGRVAKNVDRLVELGAVRAHLEVAVLGQIDTVLDVELDERKVRGRARGQKGRTRRDDLALARELLLVVRVLARLAIGAKFDLDVFGRGSGLDAVVVGEHMALRADEPARAERLAANKETGHRLSRLGLGSVTRIARRGLRLVDAAERLERRWRLPRKPLHQSQTRATPA